MNFSTTTKINIQVIIEWINNSLSNNSNDYLSYSCVINWLKYHFRNSDDLNTHRPLTMVFNCNFERVYEEKERKETENTIHYYKFNHFM